MEKTLSSLASSNCGKQPSRYLRYIVPKRVHTSAPAIQVLHRVNTHPTEASGQKDHPLMHSQPYTTNKKGFRRSKPNRTCSLASKESRPLKQREEGTTKLQNHTPLLFPKLPALQLKYTWLLLMEIGWKSPACEQAEGMGWGAAGDTS